MNQPDIRCFVYLQRLIETPASMSQCCNLLSWRATRPIYHLYLKAFNLIYETFFCKPCPRTFKGGVRSPAPKTALPQTSLGPRDWRKGARRPRYQEGKKKRKPVLYHKEEEGCRSICVFLPGILLIICGIPNDELAFDVWVRR